MPCDADTIAANACTSEIGKVTDEIALLQLYVQSAANWLLALNPAADISAASIDARACTSGVGKLKDETQLYQLLTSNLCEMVT